MPSTTFTDSAAANYTVGWHAVWATARNFVNANSQVQTPAHGAVSYGAGPLNYIYRGTYFFDTHSMAGRAIAKVIFQPYFTSVLGQYGTRQKEIILATTVTDPPIGVADYDRTLDGVELGEIACAAINTNQYNDIILPNSCINKSGYTKLRMRYGPDVDNEAPVLVVADYGAVCDGSTGAHPPKLYVEYAEGETVTVLDARRRPFRRF